MPNFTTVKLADIAEIITGSTPPASQPDSWGNEVEFITPSDQSDSSREANPSRFLSADGAARLHKRLVPARSTNLTCIGSTIGKVSMAMSEAVTNQQINSIVANRDIANPDFIYYMIKNWSTDLKQYASGSATPIINKSALSNYEFSIPPLAIQQAIGEVLGALDDKIAANTKLAQTSLELSRAKFKQLINQTTNKASLKDVLSLEYGKSLPAPKRHEGDVDVFGSGGIVGTHNEALFPGPGVIVGRKGTAGTVHWAPRAYFPIDTTYYVVPRKPSTSLIFCMHLLETLGLNEMNSDSAVPGLNREEALATQVLIPEVSDIQKFTESSTRLFDVIDQSNAESRTLASMRDTLLPRLMSGKLTVKQAEEIVASVV